MLLGVLGVFLLFCCTEVTGGYSASDCRDGLDRLHNGFNTTWAKKLWDSWGRPPSGVLSMQRIWPGSYRQCKRFKNETNEKNRTEPGPLFNGRFCWIQGDAYMDWTEKMGVRIGICMPKSCSTGMLRKNLSELQDLLEQSNSLVAPIERFSANSVYCESDAVPDSYLIGFICMTSVLVGLVLTGTVVDYYLDSCHKSGQSLIETAKMAEPFTNGPFPEEIPEQKAKNRRNDKSGFHRLASCFSILGNLKRLGNLGPSSSPETDCLHGVRTLAMVSVITAHACSIFMDHGDTNGNIYNLLDSATIFGYMFIRTGTSSVDTFFVLSGFLLTFVYFSEISKKTFKMNWIFFYVHRYLRLTPSVLVVAFTWVSMMPFLGTGPFWTFVEDGWIKFCHDTWWHAVLYIQNITGQFCGGWLWYLSCDMQLYAISPIFLIILKKSPRMGLIAVFLAVAICDIVSCFLSLHYDLQHAFPYPRIENYGQLKTMSDERSQIFAHLYTKPYTRSGAYFSGFIAGYGVYLFTVKNIAPTKAQAFFGWCMAAVSCVLTTGGMAASAMPSLLSAIFNGVSHTAWGVGISWLIYASATGYGGFFRTFLSSRLWRVPSRLTYCAYLIHPLIIFWFYFSYKTTLIMTKEILVVNTLGFMLFSYGSALVITLLVESPVMALDKLILRGN